MIEDDFYATLKLNSGEEIFAKVAASEEENRTMLILHSPIKISEIRGKVGIVGYKVEPWLKTTKEDMFIMNLDHVVTLSESSDMEMIAMYQRYLRDAEKDNTNQAKMSRKMGYLGNIPMAIIRPMAKRKRSEHYVNNKEFLAALIRYREDVEIAQIQDKPKPVIPRYIGECFLKIANHLSFKPNFVNYMFKEDMISDGIENCVQYIHNFNPEKSQNPFAYFTQIIHYAFLRRIQREKRQLEIKNKILEKSGYNEVFDDSNRIDGDKYSDYNQIKDAVHAKLRN